MKTLLGLPGPGARPPPETGTAPSTGKAGSLGGAPPGGGGGPEREGSGPKTMKQQSRGLPPNLLGLGGTRRDRVVKETYPAQVAEELLRLRLPRLWAEMLGQLQSLLVMKMKSYYFERLRPVGAWCPLLSVRLSKK